MSELFDRKKKMRLGEILVEQGVLENEDIERALKKQKTEGGLLGEVLLAMELLTEEDIVAALAQQFNYPYLPVQNCDISKKVLELVSADLARKYVFIPIDRIQNVLTIIIADPLNERAREEIEQFTGMRLQVIVGTATEIMTAVRKYYKIKEPLVSSEDTALESNFKSAAKREADDAPTEEA